MLPETWSKQENARIQKALISDSVMPLNLVRTIDWRVPRQPGVHWQRQDLKALICAYDRFSTVFPITHGRVCRNYKALINAAANLVETGECSDLKSAYKRFFNAP